MKLLLVCGPWGSGTTAVAGLLERLGAVGFGRYFHTRDPRTPNSYEFLPFRELVARFASESTVSLRDGVAEEVQAALRDFRRRIERHEFGPYDSATSPPIFLKYPLSALVVPQICCVLTKTSGLGRTQGPTMIVANQPAGSVDLRHDADHIT